MVYAVFNITKMRGLITILMVMVSLVGISQTQPTLPTGSILYSNSLFKDPAGNAWTGKAGDYTNLGSWSKVDSLVNLGYSNAQIDSIVGLYLPLTGGTVSGNITATTAPTIAGHLTNKTYVDAGDVMERIANNISDKRSVPYTGDYRVSLGNSSGRNASGTGSIYIGDSAGLNATGGTNGAVFIGSNSGNSSTADNLASVVIGNYAGQSTTGQSREAIFIGNRAGVQSLDARNSVFIGNFAGSGVSGRNSILIGDYAGGSYDDNVIGNGNIILGTRVSLANGATRGLNIGGVLFGTNMYYSAVGDPSIIPEPTGRIGVGVVTPLEKLHVDGEVRALPATNDLNTVTLGQLKDSLSTPGRSDLTSQMACVVQWNLTTQKWEFITSVHEVIGIDSVVTLDMSATRFNFEIHYPTVEKVGAVLANIDDSFSEFGVTCGTSVGPSFTRVRISKNGLVVPFEYNGTSWEATAGNGELAPNSAFTFDFTGGVLTVTHTGINLPFDAITFENTGIYTPKLISKTNDSFSLSFIDGTGSVVTTPDTDMKTVASRAGTWVVPNSILKNSYSGYGRPNIWILGSNLY